MIPFLRRLVSLLAAIPNPDAETLDLLMEAQQILDDAVLHPPIMAMADAARELGVPYQTIRRAVAANKFTYWQDGVSILLDRKEFIEWIKTVYRPGVPGGIRNAK